ncbi:GNAT family N-acetyltransferase [Xenorhabdus khoisanae]|uniref:GNAT family N-acetyltransferase n=1 Tax=Xenorhabdus khoisanae TaxID=880157 RepID=UPI002359875A|nr:GNAT family N-acetyltransferase [Xenorhabdus khoisanae]MDC9614246.1 GNAT family N-acetyltransferase [Xenorhabdus khoisanae]
MLNREENDATVGAGHNSAIIMAEKFYPKYQAKIKEVNQNDMLSALNEIQRNESSYSYKPIREIIFGGGHHTTFINTCESIKRTFNSAHVTGGLNNYRHFICSVTNRTVGIIILMLAKPNISDNNIDQIAFILTYPNGYGYGGLLVRHVVNISLALGHQGILRVYSELEAEIFYQKLGFVPIHSSNSNFFNLKHMELKPANNNKWHNVNGEYQLTSRPYQSNSDWRCHLL